jgi:hypothetical protein
MTISYTPEEMENARLASIAGRSFSDPKDGEPDPNWLEELEELAKPGNFSYHEAVHTTSLYMDDVGRNVMEHPAVLMDKDAFALAHQAHTALFNLYQYLAERHMADAEEDDKPV